MKSHKHPNPSNEHLTLLPITKKKNKTNKQTLCIRFEVFKVLDKCIDNTVRGHRFSLKYNMNLSTLRIHFIL